jgi:hypothetical protein
VPDGAGSCNIAEYYGFTGRNTFGREPFAAETQVTGSLPAFAGFTGGIFERDRPGFQAGSEIVQLSARTCLLRGAGLSQVQQEYDTDDTGAFKRIRCFHDSFYFVILF